MVGESGTRLQRLQRQRQRANQRNARSTPAAAPKKEPAGDDCDNDNTNSNSSNSNSNISNSSTSGSSVARKAPAPVVKDYGAKKTPVVRNTKMSTTTESSYAMPRGSATASAAAGSTRSKSKISPKIQESRTTLSSSSPSLSSETSSFHNKTKIRSNNTINSNSNSNSVRTTKPSFSRSSSASTSSSMPRVIDGQDDGGVEIVALDNTDTDVSASYARLAAMRTPKKKKAPGPLLLSPVGTPPKAKAFTSKTTTTITSDPPKVPSPKSQAVSQSIAESRHFSRYGRPVKPPPSIPKIKDDSINKKSGDSWFQYTNGTASGSLTSSSSATNSSAKKSFGGAGVSGGAGAGGGRSAPRLSEKPRTMEELEFYNERYARTPVRNNTTGTGFDDTTNNNNKIRHVQGKQSSQEHNTSMDESHVFNDEVSTLSGIGNSSVESNGLTLVQATETVSGYKSNGNSRSNSPSQRRFGRSNSLTTAQKQNESKQPSTKSDSKAVSGYRSYNGGGAAPKQAQLNSSTKTDAKPLPGYLSNNRVYPSKQSAQLPQASNNDITQMMPNSRKNTSFSSQSSTPSDGETSKDASQRNHRAGNSNMWKESTRVNKSDHNQFKSMSPANKSYKNNSITHPNSSLPNSSVSNENNTKTPPWARNKSSDANNSRVQSRLGQDGNVQTAPSNSFNGSKARGPSKFNVNANANSKQAPSKFNLSAHKPTKPKLLSNHVNNVGDTVKISPSDDKISMRKSNTSISVRHGGTPVWIHASILCENGDLGGDEWEWVCGYLQPGNEDDSVSVTVDDPNSPRDINGHTYTIPKSYNDGTRILMGNTWWSASPSCASPSPVSVSQPLDTLTDADSHGMPPGDLVEMTHLHEPAIVHALQARYRKDMIYTNTGAILLALNPFKKLDHLYTREMMELYWRDDEGENGREGPEKKKADLPPHAYAAAERAYSSMLRTLEERDDYHSKHSRDEAAKNGLLQCNQSILVSGESGAGKTVTTKIIMRYLSILSQRHSDNTETNDFSQGGPSVEMQVLQSNPVLESFGNARTIRNDNSSRFGKFIEMSFQAKKDPSSGQRGSLLGATIDTYLLEKVRLVSVNPGERNYHIFYELLSPHGMSINDKKRYMLTNYFGHGNTASTVNDFNMTSMSGTFDRRDGVDDSDTYGELRTAMDTVGFSVNEQDGIFSIVSALLYASNLKFVDNNGSDDCLVYDRDGTSEAVSTLMGVSDDSLKMALTTSLLEARGEILMKRLSMSQAEKALEATVKATYGALFTYIVKRINKSIEVHGDAPNDAGGMMNGSNDVATIGVLDIFGFETFEKNSFEQLCINFCNEALQQQFNRFVFKAEQAEYEYEGIEWSNINFPDNQEALDLIEAKRSGIFAVLDEQCRLPRRTDQTFAKAVYDKCDSNKFFTASRMQKSKGRFAVMHYAGEVEYDTDSFILKNKDELPKSASDLLASSTVPLIAELACILSEDDPPVSAGNNGHAPMKRSSSSLARATVSGQFVSQLKGLRSRIATTEPHYIRCLKPNDRLVANHFDETLIAHQLNCAGVLPAMKIARAGFAMRYLHAAFIQRYRPIVGQELSRRTRRLGGHQITCQFLISLLSDRLENEMKQRGQLDIKIEDIADIVSWGVQVGKSKVFLRTTAFEALEELRNSTMNDASVMLQARARTFLCQNKFYLILGSVLTLQCAARKLVASIYVRRLRVNERAITIQKQWRCYRTWYLFQNTLYLTTWCQRFWRGGKVRERFVRIKQYRSAIIIQSAWRCHVFQQLHQQLRNSAIMIQCFFRVCVATRLLKQLKREAKDMRSIAMERDKLRIEMRQMKRELEQVKNGQNGNAIQPSDSWTTERTGASQEERLRKLADDCAKKDQELQMLRREVETLRGSGRSVPSTLPLTVTVDTASPPNKPGRFSPMDLALLPSGESSLTKSVGKGPSSPIRLAQFSPMNPTLLSPGESPLIKSVGMFPTSPCLLDAEVEDLPQLECSQISLPDSSIDQTEDTMDISAINQTNESSFIDCVKIDELPFHQAVQRNDRKMLLNEIRKSSDIELGINSADSNGRNPLHIAVQGSNLEFVKILMSHDAVANTQDFSGNTALHYADSPEMTQVLLEGGISPNIPNGEGLCSLHLAVKRRDFISVKHLVIHGADVNNADDEFWYTPLHLVAHAESSLANTSRSLRGPIAELLCEAKVPSVPDLNYQDRDGNTPLHHAASLVEEDAGILISLFLEHGSSPKIANHRGQTPIHLFCHNHAARQFVFFHEALHLMLVKGAEPNKRSLSGCTALHLALYHQDVIAAALLVRHGAQLNMNWKKPQKWETSWTNMGSDDVLPLDMLEDVPSIHKILAEISTPQNPAPHRLRCMHCKVKFGMFGRHHNCTHCGRSVCGKCCAGSLRQSYFPALRNENGNNGLFKVCSVCEPVLLSKIDRIPTTIVSGGICDQSSIGTISM